MGATFAYFTATEASAPAEAGTIETTTAQVGGVNLTSSSTASYGKLDYPGGVMVTPLNVKLEKTLAEDANEYSVSFGVEIDATGTATTDVLNYYIVGKAGDADDLTTFTNGCKVTNTEVSGQIGYSYSDCGVDKLLETLTGTKLIGYGTITGNVLAKDVNSDESFDASTKFGSAKEGDLSSQTLSTPSNLNYTYYLIVEFPNKETSQNEGNMNKQISVKFKQLQNVKTSVVED